MLKETNVVMLPTNEKASTNGLVINPSTDKIQYNDTVDKKGAKYYTDAAFTYNHIYITSDEDIKEGDWCIQNGNYLCKITCNQDRTSQGLKKIIATTDNLTFYDGYNSWFIPSPSDGFIRKFIEKYNAGTPITKVMVEYEEYPITTYGMSDGEPETDTRLKVDKDNCITIRPVKESWTREELPIEAMKEYNELLFEATCHAASGFLANPRFSGLNHSDIARSAIVAGRELVREYMAEIRKDDYVTDDGFWLNVGDNYYPIIREGDNYHYEEKIVAEFTCPFEKMKCFGGDTILATTIAIYSNKETAEKECSYRNEFLKAGIIKTDSK